MPGLGRLDGVHRQSSNGVDRQISMAVRPSGPTAPAVFAITLPRPFRLTEIMGSDPSHRYSNRIVTAAGGGQTPLFRPFRRSQSGARLRLSKLKNVWNFRPTSFLKVASASIHRSL
jgi:hypothetical protein